MSSAEYEDEHDITIVNFNIGSDAIADGTSVLVIAFDVETIGACMTKNAMPEIGAAAALMSKPEALVSTFEGHMKIPEGCGFEERCEREFWDVHKKDAKHRVLSCETEPEVVMRAFVDWVHATATRTFGAGVDYRDRVRFVSDAAYFDAGWVSLYLTKYAGHHPLHLFFSTNAATKFSPVIDTNAFYRGVARVTPEDELAIKRGPAGWFSADTAVWKALVIPESEKPDTQHDHRAVNDATNILQRYLTVLKYVKMDSAPTQE